MERKRKPQEIVKNRLFCAAVEIFEEEYEAESEQIKSLLQRSSESGESNSVLLIGPRGSGKTTLVQQILIDLLQVPFFAENTRIVSLNGLIHINDRIALKEITRQLNLDKAAEGKVFHSFAENLAFLLACLRAGAGKTTKSVVFILDEFDLLCAHHNQTLLYNLFDVAQSAQSPICVVGITHRLDVIELLEKRVKSRFSHRQIFLHPSGDPESAIQKLQKMLQLPEKRVKKPKIPEEFLQNRSLSFLRNTFEYKPVEADEWCRQVEQLFEDETIQDSLRVYFELNQTVSAIKSLAFEIASMKSVSVDRVNEVIGQRMGNNRIQQICSLSVLEVSLLIAMNHHMEIYDGDPFNFEMVLNRFMKFASASTTMKGYERETVNKAFDHLKVLEMIQPTGAMSSRVQECYQLHELVLKPSDIKQAVGKYQHIPTDVYQWAQSSLI